MLEEDIKTRADDVFEPVSISHRESESRIDETSCVTGEARRQGKPSSHLAEGAHDDVDDETDECVRNEKGSRTGLGQCGAAASEIEAKNKI